ncbi:hypothetical protein L5515_008287 [Caenorhabditis briggsae]|uniref:Major facilitator superfamily (MFS) profile domain-containing protein n=3 Tax=Caenorhabditis briggsae TaxID=6238 RepID=A0AAE9F6P5_CAEBR|nr:hypothetical protein L5515_008287 [Caenorhabditis briggsae]
MTMVTIESGFPDVRHISNFVFLHKTRFVIMILSLLCMTVGQMNSLTFNFTVICMQDIVEDYHKDNRTDLHWMEDPSQKSFIFSGVAIGAVIGLIPLVPMLDQIGLRITFTLFGLISAASSLLFPLAVSIDFYAVFFVRILQGIGTSILYTVVAYIPGIWAPKNEMGTFLAVLSCGFQLSNIICMPVSGILCESEYGWRPIYYIFGSLTVLVYVAFFFFYSDAPKNHFHVSPKELSMICAEKKPKQGKESVPYRAICSDKCVLATWLAMCGRNVAFYVLILYGPTYLREVLHFDVKGTGWAAALPFVSCAAVKFASGQLTDRLTMFSEKTKFITCTLISMIGLAFGFMIMSLTTYRTIAQISYTFAVTLSGITIMGTIKCLQLRCQQHVHFATAVIAFMACIWQFVVPLGVGYLCPNNTPEDWSFLFIIVSVIVIVANIPFPFLTTAEPADYAKRQ